MMEEYEDLENGAPDALNATDATDATTTTTTGHENEALYQSMDIARQLEAEVGKSHGSSMGALKATSGNGAKRLKAKQETRVATRASKNAEATIKQIATQELQVEKSRMEDWKKKVMSEVGRELQIIQMAQAEAMEVQRRGFQSELEKVREKLELVESRSEALKEELELLKTLKATKGERSATKSPSTAKKALMISENESEGEERVRQTQDQMSTSSTPAPTSSDNRSRTEKRSYASVAVSKPTQSPEKPWTQVNYGNRKSAGKQHHPSTKSDQLGRRVLFPRSAEGQRKSEADLMLALNEALQKTGEESHVRFCCVKYAPSGAISALLNEKADAGLLIPRKSNLLIRAVKSVDPEVIGVEVLEHWQRLKVHGMPLERYLGEGKMELLKREVESATGIQLKTIPRWLISESRLREQQESNNKRGSAIVITVSGESEAKTLCASGLRFGGVVKIVEKYWESGPSSVCMTCCGIGHERMGKCGSRPPKCVICAGPHKMDEHQCGVNGCNKGSRKICAHVVVKCANCDGSHPANSSQCASRQKAEIDARKQKSLKKTVEKGKARAEPIDEGENTGQREEGDQDRNLDLDTGMDLETENWAKSPERESSSQDNDESRDHTLKY